MYFVSVYLLPFFVAAFFVIRRGSRAQQTHSFVIFGRALSSAAVLMPLAALAGFGLLAWIDTRRHTGVITVGAPAYWATFTPPAFVLAAYLLIAALRSYRASSRHDPGVAV